MFPERLRYLRKKHGLTMKELGKKINVAESTISGYENGNRKPDMDTLVKMAEYFNSSTDYLLGRTEEPAPYQKQPPEKQFLYSETVTDEEVEFLRESLAVFRKYREKP
ncbi:helix-turn-helix transcriptional regulator [Halalkalibacterium halodurans]|uniref:Transcriptional regulator n=1 Tax=Halalkalibacterium halodurans (strain ATCC BAA-125 / DSM 18197 / FERM 7344 / JCM 9153 / C-125) TaxID=272558 RepID=Q9KCX6_HALH5|nr:helix-turn-helix transcriptional regulator [Halalkalibacterium halodurans]MED4173356.1 helix-turn-helix transcriptional regulator [Halalkalibacterium halodurans]BAB05162.1 transcriptional regulator [Halalkalibacterium halodurans C-125]